MGKRSKEPAQAPVITEVGIGIENVLKFPGIALLILKAAPHLKPPLTPHEATLRAVEDLCRWAWESATLLAQFNLELTSLGARDGALAKLVRAEELMAYFRDHTLPPYWLPSSHDPASQPLLKEVPLEFHAHAAELRDLGRTLAAWYRQASISPPSAAGSPTKQPTQRPREPAPRGFTYFTDAMSQYKLPRQTLNDWTRDWPSCDRSDHPDNGRLLLRTRALKALIKRRSPEI